MKKLLLLVSLFFIVLLLGTTVHATQESTTLSEQITLTTQSEAQPDTSTTESVTHTTESTTEATTQDATETTTEASSESTTETTEAESELSTVPSTEPSANPSENEKEIEDIVSLDGKTIMIVGNSMVYYGNCVILGNQGQEDFGYFYQLIASNGENATVIDHTYPGKKLDYIYEKYLVNLDPEELKKVDYLVLSEGNQYNDDLVGTCEKILSLFPETTKFRFLRQPNMFDVDDEELYLPILIEGVEKLRAAGYAVVDWGKLVRDIFTGEVAVPGATIEFMRTSFMKENKGYTNLTGTAVHQGAYGDRNHQNPLSGYITAQMLYTSITNRSAVFSDYSFCSDKRIHHYFDLLEFERVHYTGEAKTNFRQIFASAPDMLGLQKLIDIYVAKEGRHPLTIQNGKKATCTENGITTGSYCAVCGKIVRAQEIIEATGEHELVFLKGKAETCTEDGLSDGITCNKCDLVIKAQQVIPARRHTLLKHTTPATTLNDGEIKYICKFCNEVTSVEAISAVASISLSRKSYTYNGKAHKPTVTIVDKKGNTLKKNTDYTLTIEDGCILPGKYNIKVTYKGKYSGKQDVSYTIKPETVTKISAKSTSSQITLKWDTVKGATGYRVYGYNSTKKSYEHIASVTSGTTHTVFKLKPATLYKFKVRAYVKDEDVIWAEYSKEFTTSTLPDTAKKISATQTTSSITLKWSAVTGANAYRIYKYDSKKKAFVSIAYVKKGTAYTVKNLSAGTVYKFKIRAYADMSCGKFIGALSKEFATSTKPAKVTKIAAESTATSIKLTWKSVKGATAYRVYRYDEEKKSYVSIAYVTKATSYTVKKLSPAFEYKFRIRAYADLSCGRFIGELSDVFSTNTLPDTPVFKAESTSAGSVRLTWKDVGKEDGYEIFYSLNKTKNFKKYSTLKANKLETVVKNLENSKTYYFRVRAYKNIDGKMVYSNYNTVSVKV